MLSRKRLETLLKRVFKYEALLTADDPPWITNKAMALHTGFVRVMSGVSPEQLLGYVTGLGLSPRPTHYQAQRRLPKTNRIRLCGTRVLLENESTTLRLFRNADGAHAWFNNDHCGFLEDPLAALLGDDLVGSFTDEDRILVTMPYRIDDKDLVGLTWPKGSKEDD